MKFNRRIFYISILVFSLFSLLGLFVYLHNFDSGNINVIGVSDNEILIGSSSALGGHASFLGRQLMRGSMAYINEVNENGGIYGRRIKIISYDDEYDPEKTVENTKRLIGRDQVFALFDYVGTPTSVRIIDIVNRAKVPLIGLFTGAEILRNPVQPYIFNVRDSYYNEVEGAISYFVDDLGFDKVAVFYQNDAFGLTVLNGTKLALERRGLEVVGLASYERGSLKFKNAVKDIVDSGAEVVIMVGTYAPLAKFIKDSNNENFYPYFYSVSFVGSEAFSDQLIFVQRVNIEQYDKIILTQVVPSPFSDFEIVKDYRNLMKKYYPWSDVNYVGLEGFVNAEILVEALKRVGENLTRERLVLSLESMKDFNIGIGKNISYSENDHQGLDGIYYSRLNEDGFEVFSRGEEL